MPAGSDTPAVSLPHTFRPFGVRLATTAFAIVLVGTTTVIWFAFSQDIRDQFTVFQRATVLFFGGVALAALYALGRSAVVATNEGVKVVNGYRVRRYEWNEIIAVTLRSGSPWSTLDLADGTSTSAMGIQGSDGARARAAVRQLRGLIAQQSRTDRND